MIVLRDLRLTIARDLGRTPEEAGRMPLSDAFELADSYREAPPVHLLIAGYLGALRKSEG